MRARRFGSWIQKRFGSNLVVQKYGGTSLGTEQKLRKVLPIVHKWNTDSHAIVVVSAFSAENKEEGTTTLLLKSAQDSINQKNFRQHLDKVADTHLDIIYSMIDDRKLRHEIRRHVNSELELVKNFCQSLSVIRELSPRSHDLIIGCGERLAAGVFAGVCRANGIPAEYVDLSKLFPEGLDMSKPGYQHHAKRKLKQVVEPILEKEEKTIPVITGFFGDACGGIIKAVGRGYTDLTSALVAGSVGADALQIWKESSGVFTGNPTRIEKAKLLNFITPREAEELTHFGNEVLHPFTMACAIEDDIPLYILNTFEPESAGTFISQKNPDNMTPPASGITAVCSKKAIKLLAIMSTKKVDDCNFLAQIFERFAYHRVGVDLMSATVSEVSVTLNEVASQNIQELIVDLQESGLGNVELMERRAVVSCIGEQMRGVRGLAARMFGVLADAGVNCDMITQSVSELNMSVVMDEKDTETAIRAIHKEFIEDERFYKVGIENQEGSWMLKEKQLNASNC